MSALWQPSPDEWYDATLFESFPYKDYIIAELSTGERVWVATRTITYGGSGGHYCNPDVPAALSVRIVRQNHPRAAFKALECQIEADQNFTATEQATVTYWKGISGAAQRPCGCYIFTRDESDIHPNVGDIITISVAFSEFRQDFMGSVI
jgi:hypothetical protein